MVLGRLLRLYGDSYCLQLFFFIKY